MLYLLLAVASTLLNARFGAAKVDLSPEEIRTYMEKGTLPRDAVPGAEENIAKALNDKLNARKEPGSQGFDEWIDLGFDLLQCAVNTPLERLQLPVLPGKQLSQSNFRYEVQNKATPDRCLPNVGVADFDTDFPKPAEHLSEQEKEFVEMMRHKRHDAMKDKKDSKDDCDGQEIRDQAYLWGLTQNEHGDIGYGTGPSVPLLFSVLLGNSNRDVDLKELTSPPQMWLVKDGRNMEISKQLKGKAEEVLEYTLGIRAAGVKDNVMIFAGPCIPVCKPDLSSPFQVSANYGGSYDPCPESARLGGDADICEGVSLFAFEADTGKFLDYKVIPAWSDVRRFTQDLHQPLLLGIGRFGQPAAVVQWVGDSDHPLEFRTFGTFGNDNTIAAEVTWLSTGEVAATTWVSGLFSPIADDLSKVWVTDNVNGRGLSGSKKDHKDDYDYYYGHYANFVEVFSISDYDPDRFVRATVQFGQLTEYEGQVYFGTLQTPLTGLLTPQAIIGLAQLFGSGGGDLIDTLGDGLKVILGTHRPTSVFRFDVDILSNYGVKTQYSYGSDVELLYGSCLLPVLDCDDYDVSSTQILPPEKMTELENKLLQAQSLMTVGTYGDYGTVVEDFIIDLIEDLIIFFASTSPGEIVGEFCTIDYAPNELGQGATFGRAGFGNFWNSYTWSQDVMSIPDFNSDPAALPANTREEYLRNPSYSPYSAAVGDGGFTVGSFKHKHKSKSTEEPSNDQKVLFFGTFDSGEIYEGLILGTVGRLLPLSAKAQTFPPPPTFDLPQLLDDIEDFVRNTVTRVLFGENGGDLYVMNTPNSKVEWITKNGMGNPENYGFRNMIASYTEEGVLWLGTANPASRNPEGGYELIRLTVDTQCDRPGNSLIDRFLQFFDFFGTPLEGIVIVIDYLLFDICDGCDDWIAFFFSLLGDYGYDYGYGGGVAINEMPQNVVNPFTGERMDNPLVPIMEKLQSAPRNGSPSVQSGPGSGSKLGDPRTPDQQTDEAATDSIDLLFVGAMALIAMLSIISMYFLSTKCKSQKVPEKENLIMSEVDRTPTKGVYSSME